MKSFQHGRWTNEDRIRRKGRKRNLPRAKSLVLAAPVLAFACSLSAWTSTSTSNVPSTTNAAIAAIGFPVVDALPDVRRTSPLSSSIERAVQRKAKKKIEKSLRNNTKEKVDPYQSKRKKQQEHRHEDSDSDGGGPGRGSNTISSSNDDNNSNNDFNSIHNCVKIESFVAPRKFPVRMFLRTACLLLAVRSFLQCSQTSGIPYAQTVWKIVYGTTGAAIATSATTTIAAMEYVPTALERTLAQMILSCNDDSNIMLPPELLPSAGPLLKFVASIAAYIGLTLLLPHWSTKFRVLLDYRKLDHPSLAVKKENTSVLVRLGNTPSSSGSAGKSKSNNLLVIPLQESSKSKMKTTTESQQKKKNKKEKTKPGRKSSPKKIGNNSDDIIENNNYVHPSDFYFEVDHSRIYCDLDTKECIDGAPALQTAPLSALQQLIDGGGLTKKRRRIAKERYEPYNTFPLATPTLQEAFLERISSPLVVIQLIGRLVSLLEEGAGAAVSMFITLAQHYYNAQQAIVSATQLAQEVKTNLQDTSGYQVSVWKESKQRWVSAAAGHLVPGDMFRLTMSQQQQHAGDAGKAQKQQELIVPVDALVVKGQCLTNEAILTGECVPQIKIPLDFEETEGSNNLRNDKDGDGATTPERRLDMHKDRSSILFAGTTLFHTLGSGGGISSVETTTDTKDSTAGGVTCIALRTGTYSSKGRLLKALKGSAHVGAISNEQSEKDAICMIASLSCCAALSCLSLFVQRKGNAAKVSSFRRVIQCTRIALASIPSDLPLALASIARFCSKILRHQSDVVCSEPGSLLTAAYIDTVVFDKVMYFCHVDWLLQLCSVCVYVSNLISHFDLRWLFLFRQEL
jgi:hypothetical protein